MIINGDIAVDDRGSITFVNDFDFQDIKRFYMVQNHSKGFIRAWHGHKKEGKYVYVVSGAAIIGTVSMDTSEIQRVILSASKPRILYISPGNYNGFKTLTDDTRIIFFSTTTLEESKDDDIRQPADRWNVFGVEER